MNKNYTHITFVLDRSGSMGTLKSDTIGAVNKFVEEQKAVKGKATFTLALFDDQHDIVHDFVDLKFVNGLNNENYVPRGWTALHDAIGRNINRTGSQLAAMKEQDRPEKVLFVIMTDGHENYSREFSLAKVASMIDHQDKTYNWDFVFLGADKDTFLVAKSLNIPAGNTNTYELTSGGINLNFTELSNSAGSYRSGSSMKGKFFGNKEYEFDVNGKPQVKNVT
jgi:hypothetical protein